jgi:tubulin polyglutamylase TTLL5
MAMRMSPKAAQVFNIIPLTFILPKEYVNFLECFSELEDKEGKLNYWIIKPAAKSRGRGISLVNDLSQISYGEPIVVQRYIKNPLLINGYKFDMRIYVVVTSVNPLEAFLYRDGFGRFSTIPFSLDPTDKNNKYIHLTNVSIQKFNNASNNEYLQSDEGAADMMYGGTKISMTTLKKRVQAATGVSWDESIWPQIRDVIVKTLVAC